MNWFVLSRGMRKGPYDRATLRNMLETSAITIDTHVIREGSGLARRIYCSPEILFPDVFPDSLLPTYREKNERPEDTFDLTSSVEIIDNQGFATTLPAPPEDESVPKQVEVQRSKQAHAQELAQREAKVRAHIEQMRKQEAVALEEHAKRKRAELQNGFASKEMAEGTAAARRRKKRSAQQGTEINESKERRQQIKKKTPIPKSFINKSQNPHPSHQLPKAASEAKLQAQEDFSWAKNRVNPTAQMAQRNLANAKRRGASKLMLPWLPLEAKILVFGSLFIALIFAALIIIKSATTKRSEPRFSLKDARQVEEIRSRQQAANTMNFEEPKEIAVVQKDEKKSRPKKDRIKVPKKEIKKSIPKKKPEAKITTKPKKSKSAKKETASKSLKAKVNNSKPIPASWPKPRLSNGKDLANHLYKKITVTNVRLLQAPDFCQPCQIPASLSDGTRILLTTTNATPWKSVFQARAYTVKATGLLTKSYGYYTLIVNEVLP